jgi:hypothetical protein
MSEATRIIEIRVKPGKDGVHVWVRGKTDGITRAVGTYQKEVQPAVRDCVMAVGSNEGVRDLKAANALRRKARAGRED